MPPAAASHLNTGRTGTRSRSKRDRKPRRQHAGNVFGKAAAGDVRQGFDRFRVADRGEARTHIKPRRRQQRLAQAARRIEWGRASHARPAVGDDAAHQRKAIGMHARGGQSDHDVACRHVGARQQVRRARRRRRQSRQGRSRCPDRGPAFPPSRRRSGRSRTSRHAAAMPVTTAAPTAGSSLPQAK